MRSAVSAVMDRRSDHIWQNYGRTIVDCAEDARRTNKAIECRFPVHAP